MVGNPIYTDKILADCKRYVVLMNGKNWSLTQRERALKTTRKAENHRGTKLEI